MNPEIKAKWVAALRSGQYQQGAEYLENDGRYCCLGVLCEVAPGVAEPGGYGDEVLSEGSLARLGLTNQEQHKLTELNDARDEEGNLENPFPKIADYIEANL